MINKNCSFNPCTYTVCVRVFMSGSSKPCFERIVHDVDLSSFPFDSCTSSLVVLFGSVNVEVSFLISLS